MRSESPSEANARRARTIVTTSSPLFIGAFGAQQAIGRHLVDLDGSIVCLPEDLAGPCAARLHSGSPSPDLDVVATDVCPVPQPDRQRGSVRLRGTVVLDEQGLTEPWSSVLGVAPDTPVARFVPHGISLRHHVPSGDPWQAPVDRHEYEAARPDALAGWEAEWIHHLDRDHRDSMTRAVAARYPLGPGARCHPLGADEYGIDVRIYDEHGVKDRRLPFPTRARCGCQALESLKVVLADGAPT